MDPNKVQLNNLQKLRALGVAIDKVMPWPVIVIFALLGTIAFYVGITIPVISSYMLLDIVVRILAGLLGAGVFAFLVAVVWMFFEEQVMPTLRKISEQYDKAALEEKKKVLDNVIDNQILK